MELQWSADEHFHQAEVKGLKMKFRQCRQHLVKRRHCLSCEKTVLSNLKGKN